MPELLKKYLNEQLASEYEAMANYLFYSARIKEKDITKLFEDFSRQEFEHARILIKYIYQLDEEPVYPSCSMDNSNDMVQLLINSIAAEDAAVKKYTMIEQIIENPEYKKIISDTIKIEKLHYQKLTDILENVKRSLRESNDGQQT